MSLAHTNAAAASILVEAVASAGLTHALICPGSRNTPLVLAMEACERIQTYSVIDERAAGFIALGLARAQGRAAAICCTSGTAAAHLLPAVIEASESGVPMLVLSADRPVELHACGAPQTVDQQHLFGRFSRWFFDVGAPRQGQSVTWLANIAGQAWSYAHGPQCGPVHLNVPFAEPLWHPEVEPDFPRLRAPTMLRGTARLDEAELSELAACLTASERGVIVCGTMEVAQLGGIGLQTAIFADAIAELVATLNWPVIAEPASQLRFRSNQTPRLITHADLFLRSERVAKVLKPDFVLRFGRAPTSKAINQWLNQHNKATTVVVDPYAWNDPMRCADTIVAACPRQLSEDLAACLRRGDDYYDRKQTWVGQWLEVESLARKLLPRHINASGDLLWEGAFVNRLVAALPDGALFHVANSMPIRNLETFGGVVEKDLRVVANRGANGIDGAIATAGGEAWGSRQPHAVALVGDLSFLHDLDGLATVSQLPVHMTIVALDNHGGGIFEFLPIAAHPSAVSRFITPQTTEIAHLCGAVGAHYRRVTALDDLARVLSEQLNREGLSVIHVPIARELSVAAHRNAIDSTVSAIELLLKHW